jgi:sugar/nucleoside kinase (ribokinase family)
VICVLGDAHLDVIVTMSGALAVDTDTPAQVRLCVGGQGANVAAWVVALGGRSRLIAARADDPAGALVASELATRGVELVGPITSGHTGVVVVLSDQGERRSMLTDRGVGPSLNAAALDPAWLHGCDWLHLSGYSLVAEPAREAALVAASAARASAKLSVDLSSAAAIEAFGPARFRELIIGLRPDLVFADRAEYELVGDFTGIEMIRKLGADGVLAGGEHYPAIATTPVDATGAGDAFAAGYLVGGVTLGLAAAARAVATMGAMP